MSHSFDLVVVGGGIVALTTARRLQGVWSRARGFC